MPPRPYLAIPRLDLEPALRHGFSTTDLGSMGLTHASAAAPVQAARRRFAAAVGLDLDRAAVVGAVHGAELARVDRGEGLVAGVDGLVTDRPGQPLLAVFADCYPVILLDPVRRCLALAHAGWRGTRSGIAAAAVARLGTEYGSRPGDLVAGIGPGICGSCYEVGEEVAAGFDPGVVRPSAGGRLLLDLAEANRRLLVEAGLTPGRIHLQGTCTLESSRLYSHRRSPDGARFACLAALSA